MNLKDPYRMGASHDRHLVGVAFLSTFVPGRFIPHAGSNNPPSKSRFVPRLPTSDHALGLHTYPNSPCHILRKPLCVFFVPLFVLVLSFALSTTINASCFQPLNAFNTPLPFNTSGPKLNPTDPSLIVCPIRLVLVGWYLTRLVLQAGSLA